MQAMLAEMPGRGLVELVPMSQSSMLVNQACKQHCYDNFIMCGDHRMQTNNKITKVLIDLCSMI